MQGWIKLHRKLLDWEWYDDINTTRLFVHLLLVSNHEDKKWRGIDIKRGQRLTSLDKLSRETGLSVSQIRTCLKKLKSTGEVTSKSHSQHTVFTMENYDSYQCNDKQVDTEIAFESQANDKRMTTNKNDKKENNENKDLVTDKRQHDQRFDFDEIREIWNEARGKVDVKSSRSDVMPEKAKKSLPKVYAKYISVCKAKGKEPSQRSEFCKGYFHAVLERAKSFTGMDGEHKNWRPNIEYASRLDTYDKVLEWLAND